MKRILIFLSIALVSAFAAASSQAVEYKLSMLPRYSSEEINSRITPLAAYLSKTTGVNVEPVITNNFAQYEKRLANGSIEIGYENPYIYVLVDEAHEVLAMASKGKDGNKFRGIIIVRQDSDINDIEDLKGRKICIVSPTSAGGFLSQKLTLMQKGIDVNKDCQILEAVDNKQENVILSVYLGEAEAGFIRESALHQADQFVPPSKIRTINQSAWLANWALSVNRALPEDTKKKIQTALVSLKPDNPVLKALKIDQFISASDQDYNPVRQAAGMKLRNP